MPTKPNSTAQSLAAEAAELEAITSSDVEGILSPKLKDELLTVVPPDTSEDTPEEVSIPDLKDRVRRDKALMAEMFRCNQKYNVVQKMQAAMGYVLTGTSYGASKLSGVPAFTIRKWKSESTWWQNAVEEARKRKQDQLDGILTGILDKALGEIVDRLIDGDEVVVARTGTKIRKKIGARDLIGIFSSLYEKRALLRGDPTARTERNSTEKDLQNMVKKLEEASMRILAQPKAEVTR